MSFLPQNTILGNLELIEVYEYYDKPLLFACKNVSGQMFIAVLIEDTFDDEDNNTYYEQWMYVSVSSIRFEHIRSGAIDLHDAFIKSGNIFFVDIEYHSSEKNITVKPVSNASLTDDHLPVPGTYIQLETQTLPQMDVVLK